MHHEKCPGEEEVGGKVSRVFKMNELSKQRDYTQGKKKVGTTNKRLKTFALLFLPPQRTSKSIL